MKFISNVLSEIFVSSVATLCFFCITTRHGPPRNTYDTLVQVHILYLVNFVFIL